MIGCGKMIGISITVSLQLGTLSSKTSISQLQYFMSVEEAITRITPMTNIGALTLNTANYKLQLRTKSRQWKQIYSTKIHHMARDALRGLIISERPPLNYIRR